MWLQEARSSAQQTAAADVYTFGVVLWEVYHGRKCFRTTHAGFDIRKDGFPRFPADAPLPYATLAAACLLPDPDARCGPALPLFRTRSREFAGF